MRTRVINYQQWQPFFSDFTHLYQGQHINVEKMRKTGGDVRACLCDMPLVGIVATSNEHARHGSVEVIARQSDDGPDASHSIENPSNVCVAEENGHAIALQIESADGSITIIRFEPSQENMPAGYAIA